MMNQGPYPAATLVPATSMLHDPATTECRELNSWDGWFLSAIGHFS
jgi:hypothetical protein